MSTAPQQPGAVEGAERNVAVSFSGELDSGEALTGVPLITEDTTSDLTISNKTISTEILTINGVSVPVGGAVQCHVVGFVSANFPYKLNIVAVSNSLPAQTIPGSVIITENE